MEDKGLGPAFSGPLYLVLLFSAIVVSYSLSQQRDFSHSNFTPPQVIGISDVNASDTLQVIDIKAGVLNQKVFGCVNGRFNFWGEITSNGAGTILYNWEGDRASMSVPLIFETAETKYISTDWQVYGAGKRQLKLHVFSPNNISSPQIPFELECKV